MPMDVDSKEAELWSETMRLKSENEYLRGIAKELSDTLLTIAPLGGSECFRRTGDDYFADPKYFRVRIQHEKQALHKARCEIARLEKR